MHDALWHWSGHALAIVAGYFLLRSLFMDRSKGRKRCRKCWYNLASLGDVPITCPECGKTHTKPRHLRQTRRRKGRAFIWLLVMIAGGYGLWVVPRVQSEGRHGFVPDFLLAYYVPHIRMSKVRPYPRLEAQNHKLIQERLTPEGRIKLRRHMRIWLALGLVDPHGHYGDPRLKTTADINANLGNWTSAGGAFADILTLEDLPKWARRAAIELHIKELALWIEPEEENDDFSVVRVMGNRRWDAWVGDMIVTVRSRDDTPQTGMTLIGKQEEIPYAADQMLALTPRDLEQAGWIASESETDDPRFVPPPKAILSITPEGTYPARLRIIDNGEFVAEFDIDFELLPVDWRQSGVRLLKAVHATRRGE